MAKKQQYQIKMKDGSVKTVEGEVFNKIWGIDKREIPYGKQVKADGTEKTLSYKAYFITHIPTGSSFAGGSCRTLKTAKLLLSEPEFFEVDENPVGIVKALNRFWNKVGWSD